MRLWGRRGCLAAALSVIALMVMVPAAWGASAWYELGTGASPVNHDSSASGETPTLASLSGNSDVGPLYVGWQEAASIQGTGTVDQGRVAELTGTPFDARPWSELVGSGRFSLNLDPGHEARQLHITVVGSTPYAAWIENDGSADQIHVASWDGSAWNAVGSASPINSAAPGQLSIAEIDGSPWIAYTEICCGGSGPGYFLHVKKWDGSAWTAVGGTLNFYPGGLAEDPDLEEIAGSPYVGWEENGSIHISKYDSTSSSWGLLGSSASAISTSGDTAHHPRVSLIGSAPGVTWYEDDPGAGTERVWVAQWQSGTQTWTKVGTSYLNLSAQDQAKEPTMASDHNGEPYVAWLEKAPAGSAWQLRTATWNGSSWQGLGAVNHDTSFSAKDPYLIDSYTYNDNAGGFSDVPVLAWSETDAQGHDQVRVAAFGSAPQNTARPQLSGTPQNGDQLTCTHGTWNGNPTGYTVIWQRGLRTATSDNDPSWHAIDGATGDTYTVQAADDGSRVRCLVVAQGQVVAGEAVSTSLRTDAGKPFTDSDQGPYITGTPIVDHYLTCNPGPISTQPGQPGWHNNPTFSYQWLRNGQPIPGAADSPVHLLIHYRTGDGTVVNTTGDGDHDISCRVTASNDIGSAAPLTSPSVHAVDTVPINYGRPSIEVTPDQPQETDPLKETLVCKPGSWYENYAQYTTQWLRNGAPIAGATDTSYRPTQDDYGRNISCRVTDTNPAGSASAVSRTVLVGVPVGTHDIEIYREGGGNPVQPTNLLPITQRYRDAINQVVISRLKKGIANATDQCRNEFDGHPTWPRSAPNPKDVTFQISEETRCRILVYDPDRVHAYFDGGVRYLRGNCTAVPELAGKSPLCPSLDIEIPSIDPKHPPQQDTDLLTQIAPATPKAIYWDLDNNRTTDAVCPGSAPVIRSILPYNHVWRPRVTIIDEDGTVHSGDIKFVLGDHPSGSGYLRTNEVNVCGTSLDPPPTPQLPCVTAGQIGRVQLTNANLCPVDARTLNDADFEQLLSGDLKQYLLRVSEQQLLASGVAANAARRPDGGPANPIFVPWSAGQQSAGSVSVKPQTAEARATAASVPLRSIAGAYSDTAAAVSAEKSLLAFPRLGISNSLLTPSAIRSHPGWALFNLNQDKEPFAYDQIYLVRDGSVMVNGVNLQAIPDALGPTAELLIPSDVKNALPDVHDMSLVGRNVASSLGLPTDPQSIPLTIGNELKQEFNDNVNAAEAAVIQQANVEKDALIKQAKDLGKQNVDQLVNEIQSKLDLGPFKLAGTVTVKAEKDGTATVHASAQLPGLTGLNKTPLRVDVTINADLAGHLHLQGISMTAPDALLFGIRLHGLTLTYDGKTGLDVKGQMLFPQLANQGIQINDFRLGPNGSIKDLDLAYLAGTGQGLPLGYGIYITKVGAKVDLADSTFGANITFSFGTSVGGGCPPMGINAFLQVNMAQFTLDGQADAIVACVDLGNIHLHATENSISLVGQGGINLGPIAVHGDLGAAFDGTRELYQVWVDANGRIDPIIKNATVHGVLGNRGIAACGSLTVDVPIVDEVVKLITGKRTITVAGGASEDFTNGRPPLSEIEIVKNFSLFTGCDIGRYYVLPHAADVRSDAAGSTSFRLPAGSGPTLLSLEGAGKAPRVRLTSPSGKVLDFSDATQDGGKKLPGGEWGIILNSEDRTVVILPRPQAGVWTATVTHGSANVIRVRRAPILPPVAIKARGSGHGLSRTLSYRIAPEAGQIVRFYETAKGETRILRTIKGGGRGTLHYTVGEAQGTKRAVLAEVFQSGLLRAHEIVARYTAPNPSVGAPRHLRVRRLGRRALITWRPATLGYSYQVQVTYGTGKRILVLPRAGATQVRVGGVGRGVGLIVEVRAVSTLGRTGPIARARLNGSMLVGAPKKVPPYKPPRRHKHHHRKHRKH